MAVGAAVSCFNRGLSCKINLTEVAIKTKYAYVWKFALVMGSGGGDMCVYACVLAARTYVTTPPPHTPPPPFNKFVKPPATATRDCVGDIATGVASTCRARVRVNFTLPRDK